MRDIRLVRLSCQLKEATDAPVDVALNSEVKADPLEDDVLAALVTFSLTATSAGESNHVIFEMSATFQLTYQGENVRSIAEDKRMAFANVNAVHNAWPYLRELVQSTTGRMSLPALTVPLLKIQARPSEQPTGSEHKAIP